jgi:predicted site-specific integrase-resolvase
MNQLIRNRYKETKYIEEKYGMCRKTLYNYGKNSSIRYITYNNNIKNYDTRDIIRYFNDKSIPGIEEENICYARISKGDDPLFLEEQVNYFKKNFPSHKIIIDKYKMVPNLFKIIEEIKCYKVSSIIIFNEETIPEDLRKCFLLLLLEIYQIPFLICHRIN